MAKAFSRAFHTLGWSPDAGVPLARRSLPIEHLDFPAEGEPVATVVLPAEARQVTLHGACGTSLVVQAESPTLRDSIACAVRRFAQRSHAEGRSLIGGLDG